MNLILHDFYLVVDAKGFPFVETPFQPFFNLITEFESPENEFESFLGSYLKKPWKFFSFTQLLEYEAFILKLREEIYRHCGEIEKFAKLEESDRLEIHEKKLLRLLKGLRAVLEQSNFLDLKINYDFLLNPPTNHPNFSLISPIVFSDNPLLTYEILMTLNTLNSLGENLKSLNSIDRSLLSMQIAAFIATIDLQAKTPLLSIIQGRRSEEDLAKLTGVAEKLKLELTDFSDSAINTFTMLRKKGEIGEIRSFTLEQLTNLMIVRKARFFSKNSYRLFFGLNLILVSELVINGVKPAVNDFLETFTLTLKEEKRSLLAHCLDQMSREFSYSTPESPDLSSYIFEVIQLSGFSYEILISEARNNARANLPWEHRLPLEGVLVRKWTELWNKKTPFLKNRGNITTFLRLADKLRFSYENLEAQMKGVDVRGLMSFSEEEKRLLDKLIEMIALDVLDSSKYLENIDFLVPIIIYFKTVYNQEESALFTLLYRILQDLISRSLEESPELNRVLLFFGANIIEESILQLLQLFFVFEIRNEATEKLNKNLLSKEFFVRLEASIRRPDKVGVSHFIFNQVLFHSLTNDNNIIRDFLIESLENEGGFQRFLAIFQTFFQENKVVFLCNFNLLRKKVLRICEESHNKIETLSADPKNVQISRLYSQIFTSCFLLWADTSSLDNDFLEITCLKSFYESSLLEIMARLREIAREDEDNFMQILSEPEKMTKYKGYLMIFCDSLQKKYKLILENLLYYMRAVIVKLYDNDISTELYSEFLRTFSALSHPLVLTLNKDYHLSRVHTLFESNFTLSKEKWRLMTCSLQFLAETLAEAEKENFSAEGIVINETPLKFYENIMNKGLSHWRQIRIAKKLEMAMMLNIGLLRKPLVAEILLGHASLNLFFEISEKCTNLLPQIKSGFFRELESIIEAFSEENMEIDHYCSVHPQNDFSRKLAHKNGLFRQIYKFFVSILKIKTRGALNSDLKRLQEMLSQSLTKIVLSDLTELSENPGKSNVFLLRAVFLFDEIRRISGFLHESKLPSFFLSEDVLLRFADIIRKMQNFNQENKVKHESLLPSLDLPSRVNFYFFCRILLNFLSEFLIKNMLFNEFSFILESDFTLFLHIIFEKVLKMSFIYWKGFFKSNEEIPLKLIKLVETLNSKSMALSSMKANGILMKPRNKNRLLQLNHSILQLFLESTYQLGLRIRSIYFYKLIHIICLLNDNKDQPFSYVKTPYLAYFIGLLERHFQAISPHWRIENSQVMFDILRGCDISEFMRDCHKTPSNIQDDEKFANIPSPHFPGHFLERNSFLFGKNACLGITLSKPQNPFGFPLFDPLDIIPNLGTIESACIQAMLTNLISRLLFSERQWDSDPALQPGLKEMYWGWNASKDFAKYVSLLLEKLSSENAILSEEELDTLHNDTIGNLVEMLKENLPDSSKSSSKSPHISEFLEVCFDFLEKYFNQQKVQLGLDNRIVSVNVIRQEMLRDLIGIIGTGLFTISRKTKKPEDIKKRTFEVVFAGLKELRMYRETGFHEKFSQELFRLLEILILESDEEIRSGSIEFLIKSAFYDGKNAIFKEKIHYKELMKENIEKSFNSHGRFFVNSLYKLCLITDEKPSEETLNKEPKSEDAFVVLRKGIIPDEIQGVEDSHRRSQIMEKFLGLFVNNAWDLVLDSLDRKIDEKPKILDIDLSVKILVLVLAKYPILMPFCLEYQLKIGPKAVENMSEMQRERMIFTKRAALGILDRQEKDVTSLNFLELSYVFYDQKPHVFRQFLLLFCNQDFAYVRASDKNTLSSGKVIKKTFLELFSSELTRLISRLGGSKATRYLENSDYVLYFRNLINLYYKVLMNKGHHSDENGSVYKEKLLEFLEILLEIIRKVGHPLDLIVLRDIGYFSYVASVYKQIIKVSFHMKTGLFYSKSSEYLKFYLNKHMKGFFSKISQDNFSHPSRFNKNPLFHNLIFPFPTENPPFFMGHNEVTPRSFIQKGTNSCKKTEWLRMKEREIHDYSKNIAIFNQQSMNHARIFLESREDLRRLAPNNPDLNIYENMRNMIKAGVLRDTEKMSFLRENYDQNSLKYIVWPSSPSVWLEKMQEFHSKSCKSKKIFLTFEQMVFELKSLTQEIRLALRNEALKYAMEAEEQSENAVNELQTQSCLTIFGCDEAILDQYYHHNNSEISTFPEKKFASEQKLLDYLSDQDQRSQISQASNLLAPKPSNSLDPHPHGFSPLASLSKEEVFSAKGPVFSPPKDNESQEYPQSEESERSFPENYSSCSRCCNPRPVCESENELQSEENNEENDEDEEEEKEIDEEEESELTQEKSRKSTEMEEESKELPEENNNTPNFLDKYGIDQGYFSLVPEEMQDRLEENNLSGNASMPNINVDCILNIPRIGDKLKLENLQKFKLLVLREAQLVHKAPLSLAALDGGSRDFSKEMIMLDKLLDSLPYSVKKKIFLQADKSFLQCCSEKIRKEADEFLREIKREEVHSYEENGSSVDDETLDNYEYDGSDEEEEEKNRNNHSISNINNNECRSMKLICDDNDNENPENLSNLAESSNNSDSKLIEKSFVGDEIKRPQTSFMKKLALDKSEKLDSEAGKRNKTKTKRKLTGRKSGNRERFLFKNYRKIKEVDENLNKIDFFLELPEIDDEILERLFEMFHYSLVLAENASQLALKSLFKLFKTLLFNPFNAFKLIDGLIYMLLAYNGGNGEEGLPVVGYGLVDSYPLITKKEIVVSGVLNNLFSMINKLVENHYCLPLFIQAKIERERSLYFKDMIRSKDFSMGFIRTLRKSQLSSKPFSQKESSFFLARTKTEFFPGNLEKTTSNFLEKPYNSSMNPLSLEKNGSFPDNFDSYSSDSMSLLNLLISYLTLYEGNGFLSYLNGDILLTLIKNLLKLSVINDGFLSQKKVKYPKYRIEPPLYDMQDINVLCQIFYQKRIRLKYFDSSYYDLFVEYSKSPLNFERFFVALTTNYTSRFNDEMLLIKGKVQEFAEKSGLKEKKTKDLQLKSFWETVLLPKSNNSLAEDFHIFRHIVKDLVVLFETPLKIFYEETVHKEFHKKFGISVKEVEKEENETWRHGESSEKSYLKEWLALQKIKKKEAFLGHLREKIVKNASILTFYELTVDVLSLMIEIFGVDFQELGAYENERLEDCYYFFIYPIKSLLILFNFLSFSQEESFCNDFIGISGIKTREILKSEKDFTEKECFSEPFSPHTSGFLSQRSENYPMKTSNGTKNKLEEIFQILLKKDFMKLITFFMQSKAEPDKLGNYLDYIRKAKKKTSLSLDIKLGYLRSLSKIKALSNKPHNSRFLDEPLTLYINRQNIWTSTLEPLLMVPSDEFSLRPLKIVFEGEEGIDYGGITREWLSLLNKEVFDPSYGLFKLSANGVSYQPNPLSCIIPDHLTQFHELGRLIGKVILDNLNIEVNFIQSFLKHILGQTLYIRDLSSIDPDLCKNLEWILENDVKDLDLTFAYDLDYFDVPITIELVDDGQNLRVNELNKKEYVKQMCYAKMASEIKEQAEAFLKGFLSLIPREALSLIDDKELGMKLCGTAEIDLDDMKQNTELLAYSKESQVIMWFWEVLQEFDQETLAKFLFFVTGSFKVPYGGFKNFKLKIERLFDANALPTAHTCFNQLDLPEYDSKDKMREKLLVAILEGNKGFYIC